MDTPDKRSLIDFRELNTSVPGEDLEKLTRRIGAAKGLNPTWSGRGADQGKDLTFFESHPGPIREVVVKWVVSCKDKAASNLSVGENDLPHDIHSKLKQHDAQGFLLVTTTTPSAGAKALLDKLDVRNGGEIYTEVWDRSKLCEILMEPGNAEIIKQFLPESFKRVAGLTTLPGVLSAFKDDLPEELFAKINSLVAPYTSGKTYAGLRGSAIWPQEAAVAHQIDEVIKALLLDWEPRAVVPMCENLPPEAFVALLYALQRHQYEALKLYWFALEVLKCSRVEEIAYNSAQFLADHWDMPHSTMYADLLHIFAKNPEHASQAAWRLVYDVVQVSMLKNVDDTVQAKLDDLGVFTKFEDVSLYEGSVSLNEDVFVVSGRCDVMFVASDDADAAGAWHYLPATLTAMFDADGVIVQHISLDTSSWLTEENDDWIEDYIENYEQDNCAEGQERGWSNQVRYVLPESFTGFEFDEDDPFIDE